MRILQLRFKNLNSLVGEWLIDFTHAHYVEDGIFAIVGSTGAGKTTVLDAICLALYGRTPRLAHVTQSGNEIMSRTCGECFAELSFETQSGRYRCHWSQHRARKAASGDLQNPKQELSDLDSGKVLEFGIAKVRQHIESITGMKFEQFTRSVLLAQGGFAAFLQASSAERAPLLEQITGTEIYSQISKKVYERHALELKKNQEMQSKAESIAITPPGEIAQIREELAEAKRISSASKQVIKDNEIELHCLKELKLAESEKEKLKLAEIEYHQKLADSRVDEQRLARALHALELASSYEKIVYFRQDRATKLAKIQSLESELSAETRTCSDAEVLLQTEKDTYTRFLAAFDGKAQSIMKTRELDSFLLAKKQSLTQQQFRTQEIAKLVDLTKQETAFNSKEITRCEEELFKIVTWIDQHQADSEISENRSTLKLLSESLSLCKQKLESTRAELAATVQLQKNAQAATQKKQNHLKQVTEVLNACKSNIQFKLGELRSVLNLQSVPQQTPESAPEPAIFKNCDRESLYALDLSFNFSFDFSVEFSVVREVIAEMRHTLLNSIKQESRLEKIEGAAAELFSIAQRIADLHNAQQDYTQQIALLENEKNQKLLLKESLEQNKRLLEAQMHLLDTMQNLNHLRAQLRDGEECPLCGALEHPYANRAVSMHAEAEVERNELSERCVHLEQQIQDFHIKISALEMNRTSNADECNFLRDRAEKINRFVQNLFDKADEAWLAQTHLRFTTFYSQTAEPPEAQKLLHFVKQERERILLQKKAAENSLAAACGLENEIEQQHSIMSATQAKLLAARLECNEAEHREAESGRLCADLSKAIEAEEKNYRKILANIELSLGTFGLSSTGAQSVDSLIDNLILRDAVWRQKNAEKLQLEKSLQQLKSSQAACLAKLESLRQSIAHESTILKQIEDEVKHHVSLRQALFGEKDPDEEELHLKRGLADAERRVNHATAIHSAAAEKLTLNRSLVQNLKAALNEAETQRVKIEGEFQSQLFERNFASEHDFLSASLSDRERSAIDMHLRQLHEQKVALVLKRSDLDHKVQVLQGSRKTQHSQEHLENLLHSDQAKLEEIQQKRGAAEQQIKEHERVALEYQNLQEESDRQKRELAKWQSLHELIGSADGRKFRNFAQGITLQLLIEQANLQLEKMFDRYFLVKNGEDGLELGVIDTYHAGEIRSVKNLSGGESFIVSLALALGLSALASSRLRIDSLFLDEGFGTLDEEVLEISLDALASLKDDGKLVGIISHVHALKERISCQITVQQMGGGQSILRGPGVKGHIPQVDLNL